MVIKINTTNSIETTEMEIKYIAVKETDKQDNYLHPRFKYRNDYNLYSMNKDKYYNTSTVQIKKELEERKLSERILRIDRRVKDESTSKINNYKTITTDLKTKM